MKTKKLKSPLKVIFIKLLTFCQCHYKMVCYICFIHLYNIFQYFCHVISDNLVKEVKNYIKKTPLEIKVFTLWYLFNMCTKSMLFNSDQESVLKAFYFINIHMTMTWPMNILLQKGAFSAIFWSLLKTLDLERFLIASM